MTKSKSVGNTRLGIRESMKRFPWFEAALILAVMSVHLYAAASDAYNFPANWFTRDDAYYYFKVAQNIAEGHGSTFDGVNPTNGYHPLWMLVCIPVFALARFDLILPLRVLLVLQGALSAATSILLYRLIKSSLSRPVAVLAAAWWAFNPNIHYTFYEFGLETGLAAFMVVLLMYSLWKFEMDWRTNRLRRGRLAGLAILALLTLLSRLDLVFLALAAGTWIILRGMPARVLLLLDVLLAVVAALSGFIYRLGLPEYYLYTDAAVAMTALSVISKVPLYFFLGLYQAPARGAYLPALRQIVIAVSLSSLITAAGMLALAGQVGSFPRTALAADWLINVIGMAAIRALTMTFAAARDRKPASPLETLKNNWRQWLEEGAVFYGIVGGALGLYMLLNKLAFGAASPVSGLIKRWWGDFASRVYGGAARNPLSFWGFGFQNDFDTWRPFSYILHSWSREIAVWRHSYRPENFYPGVILMCVLAALLVFYLNRRMSLRGLMQLGLPVLLVGSLAQIISYNMTGYAGMKEWYWISQPILLLLSGSLLLALALKPLLKIRGAGIVLLAAAGLISLRQAWVFGYLINERMPHGTYASDLPFMDSARFLEENTPPGSMVGMTGGGNVGYYIQGRTIVNMDGLINSPAYFEAIQAGKAGEYLAAIGVDYIFANPEILKGPPYRGQYETGAVLARYGGKALMELLP